MINIFKRCFRWIKYSRDFPNMIYMTEQELTNIPLEALKAYHLPILNITSLSCHIFIGGKLLVVPTGKKHVVETNRTQINGFIYYDIIDKEFRGHCKEWHNLYIYPRIKWYYNLWKD